jgi:hypothetical protein
VNGTPGCIPAVLPFSKPCNIASSLTFDEDEDFVLLLLLWSDSGASFTGLFGEWSFIFKPFRSTISIRNGMEYLRGLTPEAVEECDASYAQVLLSEELADCAAQNHTAHSDGKLFLSRPARLSLNFRSNRHVK